MVLSRPEDQKEYHQGWEACFNNKGKAQNPYRNWMRKGAEIKKIYWDMGWDACYGKPTKSGIRVAHEKN